MKKETGGPAFPHIGIGTDEDGMTLRDYFAAKAMAALIGGIESGKEHQIAFVPNASYVLADLMLKAREV